MGTLVNVADTKLLARLASIDSAIGTLQAQVYTMEARVDELAARVDDFGVRISEIERRIGEPPPPPPPPEPPPPTPPPPSNLPAPTITIPPSQLGATLNAARPGDVIAVTPGTLVGPLVTTCSGTASARITVYSTQPRGAVIDANNGSMGWRVNGSYIDIIGFQVRNAYNQGIILYDHHVRVIECHVRDIKKLSCDSNGGAGINSAGYDATDGFNEITGCVIENVLLDGNSGPNSSCPRLHGIYVANNGCIVRNNIVRNVSYAGLQGDHLWNNVVFERNTVETADMGILFAGRSSKPVGTFRNNHMQGCRIGMYFMGTQGPHQLGGNNIRAVHATTTDSAPIGVYTTHAAPPAGVGADPAAYQYWPS